MQDLTISLIQTSLAWEDPLANLQHFDKLISSISEPSDLIILPEMFNTGFTMDAKHNAEKMDGLTITWMAELAFKKRSVICGSLIIHEDGKYYNRIVCMKADGSYQFYDKKHLFRMGDEHLHFSAGNQKNIIEIKGWKIMSLICYDLRFPVWSKNTFKDGEYAFDLLVYVANWPAARSLAWTSLLSGRAIENMAFTAGVNRIGKDGRGYVYDGQSMVCGPEGDTLLKITAGSESVSTVTLKPESMLELRAKLGVGKDWDKFEFQ